MNRIDDLLRAAEIVSGQDAGLGEWLREAVLEHIHHGTELGRCLGLSGLVGFSVRHAWLRHQRNRHLTQALTLLEGNHARLAEEIRRYYRVPDHVRRAPELAADWPAWRAAIHRAAAHGLRLPETRDGVRKALSTEPPVFRLDGVCGNRAVANMENDHEPI